MNIMAKYWEEVRDACFSQSKTTQYIPVTALEAIADKCDNVRSVVHSEDPDIKFWVKFDKEEVNPFT